MFCSGTIVAKGFFPYTKSMFNLRRRIKVFNYSGLVKTLAMGLAKLIIIMLIFLIVVPGNFLRIVTSYYASRTYTDIESVPETRVAIVFGAGLAPGNEQPSAVLQDRVMTAVKLYKAGKVKKIIMSGDNRYVDYNEPQVMLKFARDNGVSSFDLQADYAGRRTYDTCYRAKYIFGVEKAILITQDFHLTRALYLCNSLGIDSIGYVANIQQYPDQNLYAIRDIAATLLAYWELNVAPPDVVLGDKINF